MASYTNTAWKKQFSGEWSFLSCDCFGPQETTAFRDILNLSVPSVLFLIDHGYVVAYFSEHELELMGKELASRVVDNPGYAATLSNELIGAADDIYAFHHTVGDGPIAAEQMRQYLQLQYQYTPLHEAVKIIVDALSEDWLIETKHLFERARLHSEQVYEESEQIMERMAHHISQATDVDPALVLCMTKEELFLYLENGELPQRGVLQERNNGAALLFSEEGRGEYVGDAYQEVVSFLAPEKGVNNLIGTVAYPGKATGQVRIVRDPQAAPNFLQGDILVTGMTRPEFLPLMKRAGAIVTDGGGVLCHAAIVARELCIPIITGTEHATEILVEGERVMVDADKGVVRRLQQTSGDE